MLPALLTALAISQLAPGQTAGFRVGIELPSQVPVPVPVENALRDMGIGYAGFYVTTAPAWELPQAQTAAEMAALCRRLGVPFTLDCHHRDPSPESLAAAAGEGFEGVLIDELTHVRLLYPEFHGPDPDPLLADAATFGDFLEAHDKTVAGLMALNQRLTAAGAPRVVATEVWPALLHAAARAGMVPCPKICKEFYSPVSLAIGLGAALQYERDLWVDVDMWYSLCIPGHPPEEVRANLLLAYWMGADLTYLEGCGYNLFAGGKQGYPFSLLSPLDAERYQLTGHGEMLKAFCTRYLPAHPRPWSFRDLRPEVAIVRFDDTDVGQGSWGVDKLYGTPNLKPDADTRAWLGLWNVLTHGATGTDGIAWFKPSVPHPTADPAYHVRVTPSYLTEPAALAHSFFVPLRGVVMYDHLVRYERLRGIPLLMVTGKHLNQETLEAVRRCVAEGARCAMWGPLAARLGVADWEGGVQVVEHGAGRFVLTGDFGSDETVAQYREFLGSPDEIRYRFGEHTLVLRRITDNEVAVEVDGEVVP